MRRAIKDIIGVIKIDSIIQAIKFLPLDNAIKPTIKDNIAMKIKLFWKKIK